MRSSLWSLLYIAVILMLTMPRDQRASAARVKRYRLNYKIASIKATTIFAQATGFKVAWQLPTRNAGGRYRRNVDDVHRSAELLYESHGFDGKSCLAKHVCQALEFADGRDGAVAKILKLLSRRSDVNDTTTRVPGPLDCERHSLRCPLQLVGVDSFVEYR